jgi:hypothetical protein
LFVAELVTGEFEGMTREPILLRGRTSLRSRALRVMALVAGRMAAKPDDVGGTP